MNTLSIVGNLVADPTSRQVQDKSVCTFTVAVTNRKRKDRNGNFLVDYFRVSAWEKMGESCQKYLSKGKKVGVTGSVSVHAFQGNDGNPRASLEVFANDVEFLSASKEQSADGGSAQPDMTPMPDGELPF